MSCECEGPGNLIFKYEGINELIVECEGIGEPIVKCEGISEPIIECESTDEPIIECKSTSKLIVECENIGKIINRYDSTDDTTFMCEGTGEIIYKGISDASFKSESISKTTFECKDTFRTFEHGNTSEIFLNDIDNQYIQDQVDDFSFDSFLKEVKEDYESNNLQLRLALNKFAEQYKAAKSLSIPRLNSFLYDLNYNSDPLACIKSGRKIQVQVESIKRRKPNVKWVHSESNENDV
ncbi:9293_t:CDS:2 [Dentiscutata heterogama]|uniref:9293_t:CDS:1 n=1 Tax=Dentiscutata heterogama TaxID=1316150 RepID=A0ACA9L4X7_9GLOM|nr:9293_t:CDS:2 [Dentiscutata heterogama]